VTDNAHQTGQHSAVDARRPDVAKALADISTRLRDIEDKQNKRAGAEAVIAGLTTLLLLAVIAGAWKMGDTVTRNDVAMEAHFHSPGHPPTITELRRIEVDHATLQSSHENEVERTRESIERIEAALEVLAENVSQTRRRR
jgi:hypothetical protein